jgi:hypothetical protein
MAAKKVRCGGNSIKRLSVLHKWHHMPESSSRWSKYDICQHIYKKTECGSQNADLIGSFLKLQIRNTCGRGEREVGGIS